MRFTKFIKKKVMAVMTVACLLAGSLTVLANDYDTDSGVVCEDGYVEYTESGEADLYEQEFEIVYDGTRSFGYINGWSIASGSSGTSGTFHASNGGEITVAVTVSPSNKTIRVGIVQPDGTRRYVSGSGTVGHTFSLTQTGNYKVYVANNSGTTVTVNGSFTY